jgi:hypothetical protein
VQNGEPIDLSMGHVTVVWQGYANEATLQAPHHTHALSPTIVAVHRAHREGSAQREDAR